MDAERPMRATILGKPLANLASEARMEEPSSSHVTVAPGAEQV